MTVATTCRCGLELVDNADYMTCPHCDQYCERMSILSNTRGCIRCKASERATDDR